jgi:hypothetical protein
MSSLPLHAGFDGCFENYETLPDLPFEPTALAVLRRVAYFVDPIMRRHNWTVPLLEELPPDSMILGNNHGHRNVTYLRTDQGYVPWGVTKFVTCTSIGLTIRRPSRPGSMHTIDVIVHTIDVIVQTLLHELTHIMTQDDHGLQFYWCNIKLLKELERDLKLGIVKAAARQIPKRVVLPGEIKGFKRLFLAIFD